MEEALDLSFDRLLMMMMMIYITFNPPEFKYCQFVTYIYVVYKIFIHIIIILNYYVVTTQLTKSLTFR